MGPKTKKTIACSVPKCPSTQSDEDFGNITLYKFPRDKILRRKWAMSIGRGDNFRPVCTSRICSMHFQTGKRNYKKGRTDSCPTIFWFNTPAESQLCAGCRRTVCKCNLLQEPSNVIINVASPSAPNVSTSAAATEKAEISKIMKSLQDETENLGVAGGDKSSMTGADYMKEMGGENLDGHSTISEVDGDVTMQQLQFNIEPPSKVESLESVIETAIDLETNNDGSGSRVDSFKLNSNPLNYSVTSDNAWRTIDLCAKGEDSLDDYVLRKFWQCDTRRKKQRRNTNLIPHTVTSCAAGMKSCLDNEESRKVGINTDKISKPNSLGKDSQELSIWAETDELNYGTEIVASSDPSSPMMSPGFEIECSSEKSLIKQYEESQSEMLKHYIKKNREKDLRIAKLEAEVKALNKFKSDTKKKEIILQQQHESELKKFVNETNKNLKKLQENYGKDGNTGLLQYFVPFVSKGEAHAADLFKDLSYLQPSNLPFGITSPLKDATIISHTPPASNGSNHEDFSNESYSDDIMGLYG